MLIRLPSLRARGVQRIGLSNWRAIDDDPQFFLAPSWLAAPFLVIELAEADRVLDPRIYIDEGNGISPDDEVELRSTRYGIFVVALKTFERVRRVRFDPSSFPSQFRFRAFVAYDEGAVRAFVGRKVKEAARGGTPAPSCETISSPRSPVLSDIGRRAAKIRSVAHHYEQVIALAAAEFAGAAPWANDEPLLSFVSPIFNTPPLYLDQLWESFHTQRKGAAELVLCDDGSSAPATAAWLAAHRDIPGLTILKNPVNGGIASASNLALSAARGAWVTFIDHDDALAPFAVDKLVDAIERNPECAFIYTDEVIANGKLEPKAYHLKPAFDPVLLSGVNYINHLSVYRRARVLEVGGFRHGFEGSQDYDLLLRYLSGIPERQILHLPYPAYFWRRDGQSFTAKFMMKSTENARRAISESYALDGVPAVIHDALRDELHRVRLDHRERTWPRVSVVIPNLDAFALISRIVDDLYNRTDYPDLEVIIVDNGSKDPQVLDFYEKMRRTHPSFRVDIVEEVYNFSKQTNRGLHMASGDYLLMLNNDIEVFDAGWLKEMVSCFDYPNTGVVGARLLYPDGSLQHAGVIVGLGALAGHWYNGMPGNFAGPMARLQVRQSFTAVTGACLLMSRKCFETVGDLDAENFAIAYSDVDFCLRAGQQGFRVVWTPFATLRHHESATRGSDEKKENVERFNREKAALRGRYELFAYVDPAFNPFYNRIDSRPGFILPATLPSARAFRV